MIAASREIKLPIPEAVYSTKKRGKKPRDAMTRLMNRHIKSELET